jgi:predicted Zn-dependent protease
VERARLLLDEGDREKALKELEAVIRELPALRSARAALAEAHLAAGDAARAATAARAGMEACGSPPELRVLLGRALLARGDAVGARDAVAPVLADPAPAAGALFVNATARALLEPGEGAAAGEKALADAVGARPGEAPLRAALAEFLLGRGRAADAAAPARKAVELAPGEAPQRLLLVRALLADGKVQEARDAALAGVQEIPGDASLLDAVGRTYERAGEPGAAIPLYEKAVALRPRRVEYRRSLAFALARNAQWKEAEKELRTTLKSSPQDVELRMHLGWVLNRAGKFQEAVGEYEAVADLLVLLGKQKDAEKALARLESLAPSDSEVPRLRAQLAWKMGKAEDASSHLEKALALDPKNGRALLLKAQILENGEESSDEDVEKAYLAAIEADPTHSWPHLYLAEFYDEVMAKPVDALKAYRKYLSLGGPDPDGAVQRSVDALAKETGQ